MAYAWVSSPLATKLELLSLQWLQQLLGIPVDWQGIITTSSTMGNFACRASARQWTGEQLGIDIDEIVPTNKSIVRTSNIFLDLGHRLIIPMPV